MRVEWSAALDQLRAEINSEPLVASYFSFASPRRVPASNPRATPALVQLNGVTSAIFSGIRRSPIPVLLPFDTALPQRAAERRTGQPPAVALSGPLPSRLSVRCRALRL